MGMHNRISCRLKRAPIPIAAFVVGMLLIADTPAAQGDFAGLVDIGGGRRIYLECRGTGRPTVVLEAGYRGSARFWSDDLRQAGAPRTMVLAGVSGFTRVCAYDRPGTVASMRQAAATTPLRAMPLAVLAHARPFDLPKEAEG